MVPLRTWRPPSGTPGVVQTTRSSPGPAPGREDGIPHQRPAIHEGVQQQRPSMITRSPGWYTSSSCGCCPTCCAPASSRASMQAAASDAHVAMETSVARPMY